MTTEDRRENVSASPGGQVAGAAYGLAQDPPKESARRDLALVVPGETDYLQLIRDFVVAIARKMGFPDCRVGEIEIAVDEACANIIEHAYGRASLTGRVIVACHSEAGVDPISLRVSMLGDRIELRIFDHGPRFAVEDLKELDLADFVAGDRRRGIGSYIICSFMDEVRHAYHPGEGNELTLVKYLA